MEGDTGTQAFSFEWSVGDIPLPGQKGVAADGRLYLEELDVFVGTTGEKAATSFHMNVQGNIWATRMGQSDKESSGNVGWIVLRKRPPF